MITLKILVSIVQNTSCQQSTSCLEFQAYRLQDRFVARTPLACLISIQVYLFNIYFGQKYRGYSYYFENILTRTLFLIYEIQIFFLLCTIPNKSFNLIIILLLYDNWFNFQRVVLLLGFGNLAGWYSYFLGTIIRHTRVDYSCDISNLI